MKRDWRGGLSGTVLSIRPFCRDDQELARKLILEGLGERFGFLDGSCNQDLRDISAYYLENGHIFVVAESGHRLVGTGALIILNARAGQVVRVSVMRACRRQGIGRALLDYLVDAAQQQGLVRLWVETNDCWEEAIGLYISCGFRVHWRGRGSVYLVLELPRNPCGANA